MGIKKIPASSGVPEDRVLMLARYIIHTGDTVRACARHFSMSKSAVHKLLGTPLEHMHPGLYKEVRQVMDYHKAVKHLRGGEATRQKYLHAAKDAQKKQNKPTRN
ncbi:MAG: sporulation transcriptional regulator SpoIIID [Clostridia bacterium]|nr:sporulation transcriptional regulator SpoIIID [Clostridia bacterium]